MTPAQAVAQPFRGVLPRPFRLERTPRRPYPANWLGADGPVLPSRGKPPEKRSGNAWSAIVLGLEG